MTRRPQDQTQYGRFEVHLQFGVLSFRSGTCENACGASSRWRKLSLNIVLPAKQRSSNHPFLNIAASGKNHIFFGFFFFLLLLVVVFGCWLLVVAGLCSRFSSLFLLIGFRRFGRSGDIKTMHLKESYNLAINNTWEGIPWESKDRLFAQPLPVSDTCFSNAGPVLWMASISNWYTYTHEYNTTSMIIRNAFMSKMFNGQTFIPTAKDQLQDKLWTLTSL